jgi:hypothetical protein
MKYTDLEIIQEILNKKDLNGNRLVDINVKSKYKNTALTIVALANDTINN